MNYHQNTRGYSYENYYEYNSYRPEERQYRPNYPRRSSRGNRKFNVGRRWNNYIRPARPYQRYERIPTTVTSSKESVFEEENTSISVENLSCTIDYKDKDTKTQAKETECVDLDLSDAETVHLEDEKDNSRERNSATRIQESLEEDLNHNKILCSKDSGIDMSPHKQQLILSESASSENLKGTSVNRKSSSMSIENDQKNKSSKNPKKSLEKNANDKILKNTAISSSKENIPIKSPSCTQKYKDVNNQKPPRDKTNTTDCDRKLVATCDSPSSRKVSKGIEPSKQSDRKPKSIASPVLDMPSLENDSIIVKINRDVLKSGLISEKCGKSDDIKGTRKNICKKHLENKRPDDADKTANASEVLDNKASKKDANIYAKVYKERIRDHTDLEKKSEKDDKANSKHKSNLPKLSNNKDKRDKNNKVKRTERSCDRENEMYADGNINENLKSKSLLSANVVLPKCNQRAYLNENKQVSITKKRATLTHETRASSPFLSDEGIKMLDETLANLEGDSVLNSILNDREVEELMSKEPVKDAGNFRKRGKSCIPLQQEQCDTGSNLVRWKSLQGKDLLCYTPFRITRSMSRNWLLSPGIPNGRETLNKSTLAKRRQSIDVCQTVNEKPSLFSEQTPYTKPAEIEFSFTPRESDDFPENIADISNVTVIYRDNEPTDPRKASGSTKIKYNGRELIKYNDLVKENIPSQQTRINSKDGAPKKISGRRKSVRDEDPDYVPHCKIVCSPRCNEPPFKGNEHGAASPNNNVASSKSLQRFTKTPANSSDIEAVDKKKTKERATGMSMPILEDTAKNISPKQTFSEPSKNKESKLSKQKEYLAANLKDSAKCVSCIPHTSKEVCVPFNVKKPRTSNAVASIEADVPPLEATVRETLTNISEQLRNFNHVPVNSTKAQMSNSFEQLRGTFKRLRHYIFTIKGLEGVRIYQQAYFNALPIPDDVRTAEVGHLSIFSQGRLDHYINKFHTTCETIDWKRVSPEFFTNMLGKAIKDKRPTFKYDVFLTLLKLIMDKCIFLSVGTSYAVKMQTYIQQIIELHKRNVAAASNVCTNQKVRDQDKTNSGALASNNQQPRLIPQQEQRFVQNSNAAPSTPTSSIMTPAQRLKLRQQIARYNQLMQNYRTIAPRAPVQNPPPQNAKRVHAPPSQAPWSINLRSLLDSQLPLHRHCTKPSCYCTIPTYSGTVAKNNLPSNPSTNDSRTSSGPTARSGDSLSSSKMQINKLPNRVCAPSSQRSESLPRKQAVPTTGLSSVNISTNSTEARSDSVACGERTQEFVDFECYFGNNDSIDVAVGKVEEPCVRSDEIPAKKRRLSDVEIINEDPPPRNPSTDSGVDSPQLNDKDENQFALYENRICHCGERAVYLCACGAIMYCSTECQLVDWPNHKNSTQHKSDK